MRILLSILMLFPLVLMAQPTTQLPSKTIKEIGIKRMTQVRKTWYHYENDLLGDTSQLWEYDAQGNEVYSCSYHELKKYYWHEHFYDDKNRVITDYRYNPEGVRDTESHYNYLENGDYIMQFFRKSNPKRKQYYKYFFDENGNEVKRQEWNQDSAVINTDIKKYNSFNKIVNRVHLSVSKDTVVESRYYYENDSVLVAEDFINKGELSMHKTMEYYPNGLQKVLHNGKQSSWYSFYDENGLYKKSMIVRPIQKDTVYHHYTYYPNGLLKSQNVERANSINRREVLKYEGDKLVEKKIYTGQNTFNALLEYVYFGDTARLQYQTAYFNDEANWARYEKFDDNGMVIAQCNLEVKGKKKSIESLLEGAYFKETYYTYTDRDLLENVYEKANGWPAERAFCPVEDDVRINPWGWDNQKGISSEKEKRDCDTVRIRNYKGGKHYLVSIKFPKNLIRHIYENSSGITDSILDYSKDGILINRMIKNGERKQTFFITKRYEYNQFDSLVRKFKANSRSSYSESLYLDLENKWNGLEKTKTIEYVHPFHSYKTERQKNVTTYSYDGEMVWKTIKDSDGRKQLKKLIYDDRGRLLEESNADRNRSSTSQIRYKYDSRGNVIEKVNEVIHSKSALVYLYDFY